MWLWGSVPKQVDKVWPFAKTHAFILSYAESHINLQLSSVAAEVSKTCWIFGKCYMGISTWPGPAKKLLDFLYTLGLLSKLDTETHLLLLLSGRRREQQEVLDMWELCKGKCPLLLLLPHCDNYFPTRAKKSIVLSAVY